MTKMLSEKIKRNLKKIVKMGQDRNLRVPAIHSRIMERGNARARFTAMAENGLVAICRSGMDCDSTQYSSVHIVPVPVSIIAWLKDEDDHNQWLDGPESMWIDAPSAHDNEDRYASADRALEAYEDGHPSTVYWGSL
jgi:hypothetical protein